METRSDEAVVLRIQKYSESDKLATLFLKGEGKRKGIAKGASLSKKRFGSALDLGARLQIVFQESPRSELLLLKEAGSLGAAQDWRRSWKGLTAGSCCLELAGRLLPERHAAPEKFSLLVNTLARLNESNAVEQLFLFQWQWIRLSGMAPPGEGSAGRRATLPPRRVQDILNDYWAAQLGKPLACAPLLEKLFVV